MEFIKKIPVIGYLVRLLVAIVKLPKHLDRLYEMEAREEALRIKQEELVQWNQERMEEIGRNEKKIYDLQQFNVTDNYIKKMNMFASVRPTIWGDEERLHISELAAVSSCTFNTNSGHITVGDYTFSGSGVSILAGSHDMHLTGLLRRDMELTKGCDIVIGEGVWLASNCTILGPCTIEDHAVVAAGAVVTPGTVISSGEIYGGVPAKCLGEIGLSELEKKDNPAVKKALERNKGVLFVKGWTEKKATVCVDKTYVGHFMAGEIAEIYVDKDELTLFYQYEDADEVCLSICIDDQKEKLYRLTKSCGTLVIPLETNAQNEVVHTMKVICESIVSNLFIASI